MAKAAIILWCALGLGLLACTSMIQPANAVDLVFWTKSGCTGSGYACNSVGVNVCCSLSGSRNWMSCKNSQSCKNCRVYKGGRCTRQVASANNNVCFSTSGTGFTGGKWLDNCRRRQLLADFVEEDACPSCASKVTPNVLFYRENSGAGTWVLNGANLTELYEELEGLPDGEKVAWLKAHGATFDAGETLGEITVVDD